MQAAMPVIAKAPKAKAKPKIIPLQAKEKIIVANIATEESTVSGVE